ncbi:AMP-binding protein, partial [Streptomyces xanthophaeus]|uniref:AMP-binding protein n=1 Tax=Streptomyces xanthophaeus TaxID=67385 RepID=UPI003CC918C2
MDPEFPDERLTGTARDADLHTLVTDTRHHQRVGGPWTTVLTDTESELIDGQDAADPRVPLSPSDVACVMFTSGSTGRPKGILSSHRNLVSTL